MRFLFSLFCLFAIVLSSCQFAFVSSSVSNWPWATPQRIVPSTASNSNIGWSIGLSGDGQTMATGGAKDGDGVGAIWCYKRSGSSWVPQGGKIVPADYIGKPWFGHMATFSHDGTFMTVSAFGPYEHVDHTDAGAIWTFRFSNGTWSQVGNRLIAAGIDDATYFGGTMKLSSDGSRLVTTAPLDNSNKGTIMFYQWNRATSAWNQTAVVRTMEEEGLFGWIMDATKDVSTVAVSTIFYGQSRGCVLVYSLKNSQWTKRGNKLLSPNPVDHGQFGLGMALSSDGNTIVVAAPLEGQGRVYVFKWSDSSADWTLHGSPIVANGGGSVPQFGYVLYLSSNMNYLFIGAPQYIGPTGRSGALFLYQRNGMNYSQAFSPMFPTGANTNDSWYASTLTVTEAGNYFQTVGVGAFLENNGEGASYFYTPSCPADQSLDAQGVCKCKNSLYIMNPSKSACIDPCPASQRVVDGGSCVCKARFAIKSPSDSSLCICPTGLAFNTGRSICVCPSDQFVSTSPSTHCKCKNSLLQVSSTSRKCECPKAGFVLNTAGTACVDHCPSEQSSNSRGECQCNSGLKVISKSDKTKCICRPGLVTDGNRCECPTGQRFESTASNSKCVCENDQLTLSSDFKCVCKNRNMKEASNGKCYTPCPAGRRVSGGRCQLCDPGTFTSSSSVALECDKCPLNTFQPSSGERSCRRCPSGLITRKTGSTRQAQCVRPK